MRKFFIPIVLVLLVLIIYMCTSIVASTRVQAEEVVLDRLQVLQNTQDEWNLQKINLEEQVQILGLKLVQNGGRILERRLIIKEQQQKQALDEAEAKVTTIKNVEESALGNIESNVEVK